MYEKLNIFANTRVREVRASQDEIIRKVEFKNSPSHLVVQVDKKEGEAYFNMKYNDNSTECRSSHEGLGGC